MPAQSESAQPTGGLQKTSEEEESRFIPLEVPTPYTYQDGTVRKTTIDGRRFISLVGSTAMPPYFEYIKNSETFERAAWQKQLLLSKGRWVFQYRIDCDSKTFDRDNDQIGWRDIFLDPTAYASWAIFCPESSWSKLPQAEPRRQ